MVTKETSASCKDCSKRGRCESPCQEIEALLPKGEGRKTRKVAQRFYARGELRGMEGSVSISGSRLGLRSFERLERYRSVLSKREAEVVEGKFLFGFSEAAIAKKLGLARSSVQSYWRRAVAKVRRCHPKSPIYRGARPDFGGARPEGSPRGAHCEGKEHVRIRRGGLAD